MTRALGIAIATAALVETRQGAAQSEREHTGVPRAEAAARRPPAPPRFELSAEIGMSMRFWSLSRRVGHESFGTTHSDASLSEGLAWLVRVGHWWFGPRLGAEQGGSTADAGYSHTIDLGGIVAFRPGDGLFRPRVIFGVAGAWEYLPPPRSFQIQQEIDSAFGVAQMLGVGIEHLNGPQTLRWSFDLRLAMHFFTHEHTMMDTRTSERVSEEIHIIRQNVVLLFGLGWY